MVWTSLRGWGIPEKDSVEYDFMGDSVESDSKDKSDINA